MKYYIPFTAFILTILSCNQRNDKANARPDHVSEWFLIHEDSLYQEFVTLSTKELNGLDETKCSYVSNHQPPNTLMGQFINEVKKYCEGLEVTFTYSKTSTPKGTILLSTAYDRRWSKALDTIFNPVPKSKYFKILKYEPSYFDTTTDIFSLSIGDVFLKDFRAIITSIDTLKNITIYIAGKPNNTKLSKEDICFLRQQLFGEELFVRRVNKLDFKFCDTVKSDFLTINETRKKLFK